MDRDQKNLEKTESKCLDFLEKTIGRNMDTNGNPLQYSCLEILMDGGAWWATVHGFAKSQTRLSDFTFTMDTKGDSCEKSE